MDFQVLPQRVGSYRVEAMSLDDLPRVIEIERLSFPEPWPPDAYRHELTTNPRAYYVVVRLPGAVAVPAARDGNWWLPWRWGLRPKSGPRPPVAPRGPVAGFAGLWLLVDEGHISNIAVHPESRGRGLGELLLVALLDRALALRAGMATLEVRVSNLVAQALYVKYEFEVVGRRKRYYRDNDEDAFIMTVPVLDDAYRQRLARRKVELIARLVAEGAQGRVQGAGAA